MSEFRQPFHVKPGAKTSEFWLALAVLVLAAVVAKTTNRDATEAVAVASAAITAIGYARSRSQVKAGR